MATVSFFIFLYTFKANLSYWLQLHLWRHRVSDARYQVLSTWQVQNARCNHLWEFRWKPLTLDQQNRIPVRWHLTGHCSNQSPQLQGYPFAFPAIVRPFCYKCFSSCNSKQLPSIHSPDSHPGSHPVQGMRKGFVNKITWSCNYQELDHPCACGNAKWDCWLSLLNF